MAASCATVLLSGARAAMLARARRARLAQPAAATAAALTLLHTLVVAAAAAAATPCYQAVSLGGFHGLALSRNTSLAFGEGGAGQSDVPASLAGLTMSVAAGGFFSCALHRTAAASASTTVTCWGSSSSAVTTVPSSVASGGGPRALAAGGYHACAVLNNASAVCWGANGAGQVSPLPAAVFSSSGVASLALGAYHSCAVLSGGAGVACWGRDDAGQVSGVPAALSSASSLRLACGGYHCCGWGPATPLTCWGAAAAGQASVPAAVASSSVTDACAGGYFTCAVVAGSVICWGSSSRGETAVPPSARDGSVAAVACGWYSVCALSTSGGLTCWGGPLGQLSSASLPSSDVALASAALSSTATANASGAVFIATGAATAVPGGASGAVSVVTGNASAASGAIVLATGASTAGPRGSISFLAPHVTVERELALRGNLSIGAGGLVVGATRLTEADLASLLALLAVPSSSPSPTATPTPSLSASRSASGSLSPTSSLTTTPSSSPSPSLTPTASLSPSATGSATPSTSGTPTLLASTTLSPSPSGYSVEIWAVSTLAGSGTVGSADGLGTAAAFAWPTGISVDAAGTVYVGDTLNNVLRKISASGNVTTLAGSGVQGFADGPPAAAAFNRLAGVAVDASGVVFVADYINNRIRKVTPDGTVSTFAGSGAFSSSDGQGTAASFSYPIGIAVVPSGVIYVAEYGGHRIRKVSASGAVTTVAGSGTATFADGVGSAASFNIPWGVAVDSAGVIYVADQFNNRVRAINSTGYVSTFAGSGTAAFADGQGASASFNSLHGVAVDGASGVIYVVDTDNNRIRKVTPGGTVTTIAGSGALSYADGPGATAAFSHPYGIAVDAAGVVYVADTEGRRIRKIVPTVVPTAYPSLTPSTTRSPSGSRSASRSPSTTASATATLSSSPSGSTSPTTSLSASSTPSASASASITSSASVTPSTSPTSTPSSSSTLSPSPSGYTVQIWTVSSVAGSAQGYADGQGTAANFYRPTSVTIDSSGTLYVADRYNCRIRAINSTGYVSTFAGSGTGASTDGQGTAAAFNFPHGIFLASSGIFYISDTTGNRIRKMTSTGAVTAFAGGGGYGFLNGVGSSSSFRDPVAAVVDASGTVYVADFNNNCVRKITAGASVTVFAGTCATSGSYADGQGTAALLKTPSCLTFDSAGTTLYVGEYGNNRIRAINSTGYVTTFAGSGTAAVVDGVGTAASFFQPYGIVADTSGVMYVADYGGHRIRKVTPDGTVTTIAGSGSASFADGIGAAAAFNNPSGLAIDSSGALYVADYGNHRIRKLVPTVVPTAYPSLTPTTTRSPSGSRSATQTPSGTATTSGSPTFSRSVSPSASVTPSVSRSPSATPSLSGSPSVSPSLSGSATASASSSSSTTPSPSVTASVTPTASN